MLNHMDHLCNELKDLETRAKTTCIQGKEIDQIILEQEKSITRYKDMYAVLMSKANTIKSDLTTMDSKVGTL